MKGSMVVMNRITIAILVIIILAGLKLVARDASSKEPPSTYNSVQTVPLLPKVAPSHTESSISAVRAANYIGQRATVCGKVVDSNYARSSNRSPTFLNFDRPYPTHPFTVVIWGNHRSNFPSSPETYYLNKSLCATGLIESYKNKPQIVADNKNQLKISN